MASKRKDRIAAELEALATEGRLAPARVVKWARAHRSSVLHGCFDWNDSRAAERYRIWQARELIVSVEVEYKDGRTRQVYVSPIVSRGARGYHRLVDVLDDAGLRQRFLEEALAELERVCAKYVDLCELAGVRAAVDIVRRQIRAS